MRPPCLRKSAASVQCHGPLSSYSDAPWTKLLHGSANAIHRDIPGQTAFIGKRRKAVCPARLSTVSGVEKGEVRRRAVAGWDRNLSVLRGL